MVSVVENIFVSDALIINDYGDDTYQYIIDDSNNSLYLTNRLALDAATSNAGIRANTLYLQNSFTIGGYTQLNNMDLYAGLGLAQPIIHQRHQPMV